LATIAACSHSAAPGRVFASIPAPQLALLVSSDIGDVIVPMRRP
jgi:hypothetical protein